MGGQAPYGPSRERRERFLLSGVHRQRNASLVRQSESQACLRDLPPNEFSSEAATFVATLNAIHPFREGNGRTQLTFLALLADRAGHPLDLDRLEPDQFLAAMIASFGGNTQDLAVHVRRLVG
ncbi:Fic family protein [Phenylobacterium sp.]|uniref:Fic family protein n=1 Tax=Phenylobacterium sp. TaxID=1871053 RepID=UPI0038F7299A